VKTIVTVFLACVLYGGSARAQSVTTEAAANTGFSSDENVSVGAAQLRAFGELAAGIRFFTEASLAKSSDPAADAFGAAYPYRDPSRIQIIEAYGERMFHPRNGLLGIRAGRYRTPFGISNGSDQGYVGFFRAPLIRYDNYFGLSNNFLEHGADVIVGVPQLTLEASVSAPADVGTAERRSDVDTVVRLQGFQGPLIVGVSRIWTMPYQSPLFASGRAVFTGVDVRWMYQGLALRGEWLTGKPFNGVTTQGWYADAILHVVAMGPVTAVARVERLDYDTPFVAFVLFARRQTIGARIRIIEGLSAQVNMLHQTGLPQYAETSFDVGVAYSVRHTFHRP
jgi:hypothetical protein